MSIYEEIYNQTGFSKSQQEIIKLVGHDQTVLELGPAAGYMTKAFLNKNCTVDVVEIDQNSLRKIPKKVRLALGGSIEDPSILKKLNSDYNFIIMADVLEHLVYPSQTLRALRQVAGGQTKLIISMPNIASWPMRKQLFFKGDFAYQESGLLDKTHLHFYTVETLPKLLEENGWNVLELVGTITSLPYQRFLRKLPSLHKKINEMFKNLSYYHFVVVAQKS